MYIQRFNVSLTFGSGRALPSLPSLPSHVVLRKLHVSPERWTPTRKRHQALPIVGLHWVRLGATGGNWGLMFQPAAEMCRFDVLT